MAAVDLKTKFEVEFLEEAIEFIELLDQKTRIKILYNIDKARIINDPKLFKKLDNDIWEFRTRYAGKQYRMLAFWTRIKGHFAIVFVTHGFVKKMSRVPKSEMDRAHLIREKYLEQ